MGTGERWWAAEIVVRGAGALLLGLYALAMTGLYHIASAQPADRAIDYLLATLTMLCWWFGCAFLFEGPALFALIPVPGRSWMNPGDVG